MTLTDKKQNYHHYYQVKLISTNILKMKKYYIQMKEE